MRGRLTDGREVNLWRPGDVVPHEKPPLVSAEFPTQRWRKCLMNLWDLGGELHRVCVCDYLSRRYEQIAGRAEGAPVEMAMVEIVAMRTPTPPPGMPTSAAIPEPIVRVFYKASEPSSAE